MEKADADADDGRDAGCQRRPGHSHPHGEHENKVKKDIEDTADQCRRHHQIGGMIVANKGGEGIVEHKKWGKAQNNPGIGKSGLQDAWIRSQQREYLLRKPNSTSDKNAADQQRTPERVGKVLRRIFRSGRAAQGIPGCRAHPDHRAQGKEQTVNRKHQIQRGNTVGAVGNRDKEGVGQNITGCSNHRQRIG